jgi:hypothetical protein
VVVAAHQLIGHEDIVDDDPVAARAAQSVDVPGLVHGHLIAIKGEHPEIRPALSRHPRLAVLHHDRDGHHPVRAVDAADQLPVTRHAVAAGHRHGPAGLPGVAEHRGGLRPDAIVAGLVEQRPEEAPVAVPHQPAHRRVDAAEVLVHLQRRGQRRFEAAQLTRREQLEDPVVRHLREQARRYVAEPIHLVGGGPDRGLQQHGQAPGIRRSGHDSCSPISCKRHVGGVTRRCTKSS